jgi:hypothetical protein
VDGAFVPFADQFDLSRVTAKLRGLGEMGPCTRMYLESPVLGLIGSTVYKEGRSTGCTEGVIMAAFIEHIASAGTTIFHDLLVLGDKNTPFDAEGDSGSVVVLKVS